MIILSCPYPDCNISIEIAEINCAIFRCGICKDKMMFVMENKLNHIYQKNNVIKLKKMIKYGVVVGHFN